MFWVLKILWYQDWFLNQFRSFPYNRNLRSIFELDDALSWLDLIYKLVAKVASQHVCCSEFLAHVEGKLYYVWSKSNEEGRGTHYIMFATIQVTEDLFSPDVASTSSLCKWPRHTKLGPAPLS